MKIPITLLMYVAALSYSLLLDWKPAESKVLFPVSRDNVLEYGNNKVGFIDSSGKLVIDFKFYSASPFSEGLAGIKVARDAMEGYIDCNGEIVIYPQYERAFPFV